ncbi:putative tumor necrosis factor ligand superfamily member 15-like [Scophthalmus maximus]|uniref:Putative tumor necrosis factor ligand superfamily member 15-like n=2 Tax=Scophthalmus maximus TaxID=52904 RepID=A0A2U9BSM7_SCOMX|nr:putative tumor necrosis factor ligand superfamily member 15-like [Scophthalmus maximus]
MKEPDSRSSGTKSKLQQMTDVMNPSAMLTVLLDSNSEGEYLEWESEKGNAHCRGGFNYSGGGLVVPRTAIYRVFLQVTYERRKECSGQLRLSNSVFFITESYKHNVLLLSSVDTVSSSLEHWRKSLYTAGSFHLEAGGRLRVTSSHRECVVDREELLFFGAEHLSSEGTVP